MAMTKPNSSQVTYGNTTVQRVLSKTPLQYATLTEATAAAASLPDGQVVDALTEQERYRVLGGELIFVERLRAFQRQSAGAVKRPIEEKMGETVSVEDFGATPYTYDELIAANGAVTLSDDAFQKAMAAMESLGGGTFNAKAQFYVLSEGLVFPHNVYCAGSGHGMWSPSFRTEPKTWEGTNLLFKGSGAKSWSTLGVTSMKNAGGWRNDPDSARIFKLTSLMNGDASGSTPASAKQQAVAVRNRDPQEPWGISGMRICPWIGVDGISDYSLRVGSDLGADWDIGLLLDDTEQGVFSDVQVRGYWRTFGLLELSAGYTRQARSEGNILRKVSAQGHTGLGVRSGDIWAVLATTPSTLEILWSDESYFPASGAFEGLQNGTDYTYTSLSRNGANLVFNGVSPNPTGTTQIRNPLRGTGFSTGNLQDVEGWALWHHSGQSAEALGFSSPAKGGEFSGFPLRGLHLTNTSIFGEATNSPCVFFHDCDDAIFLGGKFEIGHLIASPFEPGSTAVAAVGSTANLRLVDTCLSSSVDTRLFTPRSFHAPYLQINPVARLSSEFLLEAYTGQAWQARKATGEAFEVLGSAGAAELRVTASGIVEVIGQLNVGGSGAGFINSATGQNLLLRNGTTLRYTINGANGGLTPGADNTQQLGSGALRMSTLFAGTGAINTSDAREKTEPGEIPDAMLDAWGEVNFLAWRWIKSVQEKGDKARIFYGPIAQHIRDALVRHGQMEEGSTDCRHAPLCYDEWGDEFAPVMAMRDVQRKVLEIVGFEADGSPIERTTIVVEQEEYDTGEVELVRPAGNRWGIRADQCLFLEAAYQRRRASMIEARLLALEDKLK